MTSRELAMTTGGVVALAAWIAASIIAWLLVTAPATVAMAVTGQDVDSFARVAWHALYEALTRIVQYL